MEQESPYNPKNEYFTNVKLSNIFKTHLNIDITTENIHLYKRAFTHESYVNNEITEKMIKEKEEMEKNLGKKIVELQPESFQTSEFLGDNAIKPACAKYLYLRYKGQSEGFFTFIKTKIEDTETYSNFCKVLNLERYILISRELEDNNARDSKALQEDVFEAFIGALFLDKGYDLCEKLMFYLYETQICYSEIIYKDKNYKNKLLGFYHANNWSHPRYELISKEVIDKKNHYTMAVLGHDGEIIATATDTSKKKAEQKASALALLKFNQITEDQIC